MPCDPEIGFGWRSRRRNVRKSLFHTARLADGGRLCCGWSRFWPSGLEGKLTDFDVSESNLYIVVWLTSRCPASTSGTSPHQAMRLRGGTAGAPTCPLEWPALRYGSGGAPAVSPRIFRTTTSPVQARTANAGVPPSWLRALRSRRNTLVRMASAAAKGDEIRNGLARPQQGLAWAKDHRSGAGSVLSLTIKSQVDATCLARQHTGHIRCLHRRDYCEHTAGCAAPPRKASVRSRHGD